ncbi:MAG: ATP-dependent helicase [Blautia sp.]|nr:ATP-dependent helicase [Blautia sp.]
MKKNASQIRAIAHLSGPMMVLAGPGSGKTSVIVERTANMICEGKIDPSSILVVTFSKSAADEMKERFLQFMGMNRTSVTFGTFHGVFYSILKHAYGFGKENILSPEEKHTILKELSLKQGEDLVLEGDFPEEIAREISVVKENRINPEHYYSTCCPDEVFRQIFQGYDAELKSRRKLDFDDMLLYCYELFHQRKDILALWQNKFQYILVDEFQDINYLQYDITKMLAKPQDNLFIVGDDDQSIYHFRGARPEIMRRFRKDYPSAGEVFLDVNYRCSGNVLKTAAKVISNNTDRFAKTLVTPNPDGEPVQCLSFENTGEEYLAVSRSLRKRYDEGESLEDTAILFRTNLEAEGLVRRFVECGIPFHMKENLPNLFDHWICRNILAYLRIASGDNLRKYYLEIMNRPNRYISREALTGARVDLEALEVFYQDKDWMCDRITTLKTHIRILSKLPPYAAINFIRKGIGYEDYLREYAQFRRLKPEDLFEVLDRIQESAKNRKSLQEWEEYIEDYTGKMKEQVRQQKQKKEGVEIATLHSVKGLEYDNVYILNVNEGVIPYKKAILKEAQEEERRLFYVGLTRAKKKLILGYVHYQYDKQKEPSRFLTEAGLL